MDYKAYSLMAIILASLALVVPIGTTYATTNATDGASTNEANVPAINATGGGEWTTFDLTVGGQPHPIQYMITGASVENMTIHSENQTLGVTINSTGNGTLALRLPREVIDSKTVDGSDADFAAFIDNAEYVDTGEIEPAADTRTLPDWLPRRRRINRCYRYFRSSRIQHNSCSRASCCNYWNRHSNCKTQQVQFRSKDVDFSPFLFII